MSFITVINQMVHGMLILQGVPFNTDCYCVSFDMDNRCITREIEFFENRYKQVLMMGKKDRILRSGKGDVKCFFRDEKPYNIRFVKDGK